MVNDPFEDRNREIHKFNVGLDRALIRPASTGYGALVPAPVRTGIGNAASNLGLPGDIINGVLQGRPGNASQNLARLLINTTIGIGGLFDPATGMGLPRKETDFGETLYVWGAAEGNYAELPVMGPTTERALMGSIVDTAMNPLRFLIPSDEREAAAGIGVLARLGQRYRYSETFDSILYQSADSYALTRQSYIQNRRNALRGDAAPEYFDPYEDPYANPDAQ